jgi:hypothetical protein
LHNLKLKNYRINLRHLTNTKHLNAMQFIVLTM